MTPNPEPPLKKIDITIARLRLLLAELTSRESLLKDQRRTFHEQRDRLITFALYGDTSLENVLGMLADVESRVQHVETIERSILTIRQRAEAELESLQLTKGVEEAKSLLQQLQAGGPTSTGDQAGMLSSEETQTEIRRLKALIAEGSERAARALERGLRER